MAQDDVANHTLRRNVAMKHAINKLVNNVLEPRHACTINKHKYASVYDITLLGSDCGVNLT